jgi:hypothetical protein
MENDLFRVRQTARIEPYFPLARGVPRVDDRRVISGIACNGKMRRGIAGRT